MHGYQLPALSLFLLGGWIASGTWPTDYDGKYRFVVGLVNDQIASFGHLPVGGAVIAAALAVALIGWSANRAGPDDGDWAGDDR